VATKILLVAREQGFRDRLRLALERLEATGERVGFAEVTGGNEALALLGRERIDLVVAEVGTTPYGGFGLARDIYLSRISGTEDRLNCKVILVLERLQDEWLGRWSGADALVNRPVDPFALAQVARRLLQEPGADADAAAQASAQAGGPAHAAAAGGAVE
jgi:DNA-binding response OmpR family regulator